MIKDAHSWVASLLESVHPETRVFKDVDVTVQQVVSDDETFLRIYQSTYCDFIFDVKSNLYFIGVSQHVPLMAALYCHYRNLELDHQNLWKRSDDYIACGMGYFKSKAKPLIYKSRSLILPPVLAPLARDIEDQ